MRLILWGGLDQGTGFGTVTRDLGRAFIDMGVDVRFVGINDVESAPDGYDVIQLGDPIDWMTEGDMEAGALRWLEHVRAIFRDGVDGWKPEAIIVTGDPASILRSEIPSLLPECVACYHYCPIEGVDIPRRWLEMWRHMKPIAMCDFGAGEIERLTGSRPPFVFHGVSDDFYPVSRTRPIMAPGKNEWLTSKEDCKRYLGYPTDRVMLYRADRLMPRKRYWSMLRAVAPVLAAHPDVDLVMHCKRMDEGGHMDDFRSQIRPDIAARMVLTPFADTREMAPRWYLNVLYNAADIYLSTGAEGFGLTVAEAVACGVPVVGMDFTSVPEVIGDAGTLVPVGYLVENIYGYHWANVNEPKFTDAVEFLVTHKARRRELGRLGPKHVGSMTWAAAAEKFLSIIDVKEAVAA
jgi:glycosyltransferase involved in cell wall biosynthesis